MSKNREAARKLRANLEKANRLPGSALDEATLNRMNKTQLQEAAKARGVGFTDENTRKELVALILEKQAAENDGA